MGTTLVTGATGFIGSRLTELLLSRGEHVKCLFRTRSEKTQQLESLGAELIQGDLSSPLDEALDGVETVFHLAGLICALSRRELFEVNGNGTRRLAEACSRLAKPPRFVLVSSVAAAGPTTRDHRRTEDEPPRPVSNYGKSKLAGEEALRKFSDRLPAMIVRPGIVFGPNNQELLPVFRMIRGYGVHFRAGLTTPGVSMIHIDDLNELMLKVLAKGETLARIDDAPGWSRRGQGVFNACDEVCPNWQQLGDMIRESFGQKYLVHFPLFLFVAAIAAGVNQAIQVATSRPDVFNLDKMREAGAESWAFSNRKLVQSLGYAPEKTLQERLTDTARWYLDNEWLK